MAARKAFHLLRAWSVACLASLLLLAVFSNSFTGTALAAAPFASRIKDMPVYAQQRYLSCEYAATRAAVARWGIYLSEEDFINAIPENPNPHLGYRGYINGTWGGTGDYGIYPEPIANFLNSRGMNTRLLWNGPDQLKQEIAQGRPVVVWVPGGMGYSEPYETVIDGLSLLLMPYEHALTVYGYDENGVFVADPGFGTYDYYGWNDFLRAWSYLGNMGLSIWPAGQDNVNETPGIAPQFYRYWLQHGGVELLGQPLGPAAASGSRLIQHFERARLEYDGNLPPTQAVQKSLLGRELTARFAGEQVFQPLSGLAPEELSAGARQNYFPETGFSLAQVFADFWQDKGGLPVFGFPISRPYYEKGLLVQYFERARLELHPEGPESKPLILLGLLGSERLEQQVYEEILTRASPD